MPQRFDATRESLDEFKARLDVREVVDRYEDLLEDLFLIRNPRFKFIREHASEVRAFIDEYRADKDLSAVGEWFYFPWNGTLAHYLPEDEHQEIRTARNRLIITEKEQKRLYGLRVAYAGLSVGSHGACTFALMGGGREVRIADPDLVSPSNLNRVRYDFLAVGRKKTDLMKEYLYQLNPYSQIAVFDEGVNEDTMDRFLDGADVLVEETDNLEMKIRLRLEARKRAIPVIMATDNGDNIIFEAERFDKDPTLPLFNGAIGDISIEEFRSFPPADLPKLATKIAGPLFVTERMMDSLPEVGKSIYSWPQLGDAATLSGVAIAYALKRLALKQELPASKVEVNLDAILDPRYANGAKRREEHRKAFLAALGL